jgi:hypothetical protein
MQAHPAYDFIQDFIREAWRTYLVGFLGAFEKPEIKLELFADVLSEGATLNIAEYFLDWLKDGLYQLYYTCENSEKIDILELQNEMLNEVVDTSFDNVTFLRQNIEGYDD